VLSAESVVIFMFFLKNIEIPILPNSKEKAGIFFQSEVLLIPGGGCGEGMESEFFAFSGEMVTIHENDEIGQDYRIDGRVNPLLFHVFPVDPRHRLARKRFESDHFLCALIRPTQALDLQDEKQSCKSCESCRLHFREQLREM
jgi:hypothetical protein